MSTSQRYVAVKLIAGKKYVLRNGRHVTVRENPHWQCRVNYPFAVIQGPDFVVYYDEEGNTGGGTAHEHDIMRPVYEEGQTYIDGDNNRVTITRVDAYTCTYPVHGDDGEEYTLDGKYLDDGSENSESNLFDYVRKAVDAIKPAPRLGDLLREAVAAPALPVFAPIGGIPIPPPAPADPWIGKRVFFKEDRREGYGVVHALVSPGSSYYTIKVDEPCTWGHSGDGDLGVRGWNVHVGNLRLEDAPAIPTIVHDVSPDLPILATPVTPSRVGMRVEVQLDCATTGLGVITYEDKDGTSVVEFDEGTEWIGGLHTCAGHAPSGRGWWCHNDTIRAVSEAETQVEAERSEAETQVEAERSEAEALNEVDVAEVWAAYRINPSISIDAWIAARRVLKAAAK